MSGLTRRLPSITRLLDKDHCQPDLTAHPSHGVVMDLPESQVESFIVKLWTETATGSGGGAKRVKWHGQITHVSGGARHYFKDLDEIKLFIEPYLAEMGVEVGGRWRLRHWLRRLSIHPD